MENGVNSTLARVIALDILIMLEPILAELYKLLSAETPSWPNEYQIAAFTILGAIQLVTFLIAFIKKE